MSTAHRDRTTVPFDLSSGGAPSGVLAPSQRAEVREPSALRPDADQRPSRPSATAPVRPRLPWGARVPLTMAAMLVAGYSPLILMLVPGIAALGRGDSIWRAVLGLTLVSAFAACAYALVSWGLTRGVDRHRFRDLGLGITPRAVGGLAVGMAISLVIVLIGTAVPQMLGAARVPAGAGSDLQGPLLAVILATFARSFVLQGFGEEVLFRGYLLRSLPLRPVPAVLVSACAFGAMHLISQGGQQSLLEHVLYLAMPTGFAICAGFLALRMSSTWAAVGVHGGMHVASTVALALGLAGEGPVTWLLTGALFATAGVIIHLLPRREH